MASNDYPNWDRLVLEFMGSFAQLQESIRDFAEFYLVKQEVHPELLAVLRKRWLRYIKDDERPALVEILASATGAQFDLRPFRQSFLRAAAVRDLLAHSGGVVTAWSPGGWILAIQRRRDDPRVKYLPKNPTDAFLRELLRETKWMHEVLIYLEAAVVRTRTVSYEPDPSQPHLVDYSPPRPSETP